MNAPRPPRFLPATDEGRSLLVGMILLAIGLFLAWPPLAFIVPGALLVISSLLPIKPEAEQ